VTVRLDSLTAALRGEALWTAPFDIADLEDCLISLVVLHLRTDKLSINHWMISKRKQSVTLAWLKSFFLHRLNSWMRIDFPAYFATLSSHSGH
jgi:hypothetical protein